MIKIRLTFILLCCTWLLSNAQVNTVSVNTNATNQTISGFGAAIAYYEAWLTAHSNKEDIYNLIFSDLNLGILRLRNVSGYTDSSLTNVQEIVQKANTSLGHSIDILLSSWSPPARLKANSVLNGGTLLKTDGAFVYGAFAQWWYNAIQYYINAGITPTYISMQNEPDYENTGWETCIFKKTETTDYPGYGVALDSLYHKLQGLTTRPKILGPEVTGIGYSNFQNYVDNLDKSYLDGYAYHLYNGGSYSTPSSFNTNLAAIKTNYSDKINIMTEFSGGTWFQTAQLIHNCLVKANASGYLYWDLIWGTSTGGMISLENPWYPSQWTTTNGYIVNGDYYAVKHFSKYISKDYVRVESFAADTAVLASSFLSADGTKLVTVLINTASVSDTVALSLNGFTAASVTGYQSVSGNYYYSLGTLSPSANLILPASSATTLEFTKGSDVAVTGVSVSPSADTVYTTSTIQLTATISPATATNKNITWTSGNTAVATVSSTGLVTGVAAGSAVITATTEDGSFTASSTITVEIPVNNCTFGTPLATGLPTLSRSYYYVYVLGINGPSLSNLSNFTINWSLSQNSLWQFSINTNDGVPKWWYDLRTVSTWTFNQASPQITITSSGISKLDGSYWVTMDGDNFVMVSKNAGFTIYFSTSSTAPTCTKSGTAQSSGASLANSEMVAYPNPFSGSLTLRIPNPADVEHIYVTDQLGRIVITLSKSQISSEVEIGNDLAKGIYLLKVQTSDGCQVRTIVKK
jgi:glucuronoarabinoxylan endo-1,4-beta-xylanase